MNQNELNEIVKLHKMWLCDENGGVRAVLTGAVLRRAVLRRADLTDADLRRAVLRRAVLTGADLTDAVLTGADLTDAVLTGAVLTDADLTGAVLTGAVLTDADLTGADLTDAVLRRAVLRRADLTDADLRRADLTGAVLTDAVLTGAVLPHFQICPSEGSFIAWKKTNINVIKIEIPAEAKRTSSLVERKCRAEFIKVIDGPGCGGISPTNCNKLTYNKGEIVYADNFDDDIRLECTNGIHFFMTEREAQEWQS